MKRQILLLLPLALMVLASCSDDSFMGNGPMVSEVREVNEFHSIKSKIGADIFVTQGPDQKVRLETNENLLGIIETRVVNGELIIEANRSFRSTSRTQLYISAADFKKISISGSGKLESVNCMDLDNLELRITGSAHVNFCGTVNDLSTTITGSGDINAFELAARTVSSTITGSGNVEVSVSDELNVRISGSGNVLYKGNPQVSSTITGSGRVRKTN